MYYYLHNSCKKKHQNVDLLSINVPFGLNRWSFFEFWLSTEQKCGTIFESGETGKLRKKVLISPSEDYWWRGLGRKYGLQTGWHLGLWTTKKNIYLKKKKGSIGKLLSQSLCTQQPMKLQWFLGHVKKGQKRQFYFNSVFSYIIICISLSKQKATSLSSLLTAITNYKH